MNISKLVLGWTIVHAVLITHAAFASTNSIGPNGINSADLSDFNGASLNGAGADIGQLEDARPGDRTFDTDASLFHSAVVPGDVFFRNDSILSFTPTVDDPLNEEISEHAVRVAGIMISFDRSDPDQDGDSPTGVASSALLFSVGYNSNPPLFDSDIALSAQHLATLPVRDIQAINMSFAIPLAPGKILDGNQHLTQYLDWSASRHNILYVVAGNQNSDTDSIPTDNFSGMSIASSGRVNGMGKYREVAVRNRYNQDADGDRTSIDLIAPGENIKVPELGDTTGVRSGTSYAVPHVVGTVALLEQYGYERIGAHSIDPTNAPNWGGVVATGPAPGPSPLRHEVMKAVLMNSADKILDSPGNNGKYLGMERTVLKQDGTSNWFDSDAFEDSEGFMATLIPLDEEMGAGHLNAKRALQQYVPGEHEINGNFGTPIVGDVPLIGWDYGTISGPNHPINKYVLDTPLVAGNFISITLAWDREVEFANDAGTADEYDFGDTFQTYTNLDDVLIDLDLYLVPAGTNDVGDDDIAISDSVVTPVEHIFTEIPFDGDYEIWVFRDEQFAPAQDYGIAWWYGLAPDIPTPNPIADFDADGNVDAADLAQWQGDFGINGDSDADNDGDTDGADFLAWQRNFGATSLSASTAVPEPSCLLLLAFGMPMLLGQRGKTVKN